MKSERSCEICRARSETLVSATATPVAWFPVPLDHISTCPNGRAWVGTSANHVYIITLEGGAVCALLTPPDFSLS